MYVARENGVLFQENKNRAVGQRVLPMRSLDRARLSIFFCFSAAEAKGKACPCSEAINVHSVDIMTIEVQSFGKVSEQKKQVLRNSMSK